MSLPDPLTVALTDNPTFAKVWSPNQNQSVFRKEFVGSDVTITVTQARTKTRLRHFFRLDRVGDPVIDGVQSSTSFTLTIDEPIIGPMSNEDVLYYLNAFKGTITDAIAGRLLNGEL
jgi:hypothetical protein